MASTSFNDDVQLRSAISGIDCLPAERVRFAEVSQAKWGHTESRFASKIPDPDPVPEVLTSVASSGTYAEGQLWVVFCLTVFAYISQH